MVYIDFSIDLNFFTELYQVKVHQLILISALSVDL